MAEKLLDKIKSDKINLEIRRQLIQSIKQDLLLLEALHNKYTWLINSLDCTEEKWDFFAPLLNANYALRMAKDAITKAVG